ncbi:tetratricopeptide repeat protein [Rhodobacteraceae bacterium CCMM004]|nr:tetratricopeptide repeat protein [Rhodobacteraceae bacterium CCMM004]
MWEIWTDAPDEIAQALLDDGMARRSSYDFLGAQAAFDRLVGYCPDYAEGYNQRAFVAFLRQDYAAALEDLDRALARAPSHVGALSGKALTLMGLGRMDAAQETLRAALRLNPWIPERGLLLPAEEEDTF